MRRFGDFCELPGVRGGRELLGRLHKCLNAGYDASLGNDLRHPLQDDGLTTSR
jgi:hypothetical protein